MGLISLKKLEINLLPSLEFPKLTVVTTFPNAAPQEIENLLTKPISESLGTVSGIEKISSESLEGVSFVNLQFAWGTKIDFAAMEVREKVDLIRGILPEEAGRSIVSKFDPSQSPIQDIVFFPKQLSNPKNLRHFIKTEIKPYLDRIDGVALVQFAGGFQKEIQIEVDHDLLMTYQLSLDEIQLAIETSNLNFPAGSIQSGTNDILIRTVGEYKTLSDIARTVIGRNKDNVPILLGDVAKISDGYRERKGLARYNGNECVILSVFKEAGKNTVEVSKNTKKEIEKLKTQFASEVEINIVFDEARFVEQSIDNITNELLSGGVLAFISLFLILRNLQSPFILLTVLPISVITTFLLMYFKGITLNMMSLGGLSLGIGMLFDSGNVVLSAIERHIEKGLPPREAALRGANEVTGSITSAMLTTIIVFLPILFLKGVVGTVFNEMAMTITFSLSVSLVVSLTLIPMLSSLKIIREQNQKLKEVKFLQNISKIEEKVTLYYSKKLTRFIEKPGRFFFYLFFLFIVVIVLYFYVDKEFVPKVDSGEFSIDLTNSKGSSLVSTSDLVFVIEKELENFPEVKHIISRIGYDEEQLLSKKGSDIGTHRAKIRVVLKEDRAIKTKELVGLIRSKIKLNEDISINYNVSGDILSSILSPESKSITLEVLGNDLNSIAYIGDEIKKKLSTMHGIVDIKTSMEEKAKEFHIRYIEDKLNTFNLTHDSISKYLKTAIKGSVVTRLRVSDQEYDIRLRFKEESRNTKNDVYDMMIKLPEGQRIYLSQIVQIEQKEGYSSILRMGQSRVNRITADIQGVKQNEIFSSIEAYLSTLKLPLGYKVGFSGEKEGIDSSLRDLLFAFLLSVILIYMLLASQFESLLYPFIMLGTIPLISIGIIPGLYLTDKSINISSFTGIILLVGIVIDNAALFYEYVEILEEEGYELKNCILESSKIVLRPIIMNNGTTLLGLLPVALEIGEGTEFQSPMAITVICGLITSVMLSLFLIPLLFYYVKKKKETK